MLWKRAYSARGVDLRIPKPNKWVPAYYNKLLQPIKSSTSDNGSRKILKVTLKRSTIGCHNREQIEHATRALRLFRTHQSSYVVPNQINIGNICKILPLVKIDLKKAKPAAGAKYWAKGYEVIGSAMPTGGNATPSK